jgi:hypothetical protein
MKVHDRLRAVLWEVAELHAGVAVLISYADAVRAAVAHLADVAPTLPRTPAHDRGWLVSRFVQSFV